MAANMKILLDALQEAAVLYAAYEEASVPELEKPWISRHLPWSITGPVNEAIDGVPEILAFTRLRQLSLGAREGKPLYPVLLATALTKRTHALGDAESAVRELQNLVESDTGHARIVMVLAGVETEGPVELAPGVQLVPFSELRLPSWINHFAEKGTWPLSRSFDPVAPSVALIMRVPFKPLFTSEEQVQGSFPEKEVARLRMVAHCIALASGRPATILKVVYEDDDPCFPLASSGVVYSDPRWGSGSAETYMIDPERTRSLVCNYQKFCPSGRRAIDTALARLAQAWGGWYREERAIDLGIALESALMGGPGTPSNNKSEITYKLGVRAAWLIGADSKERKEVFQKIRQLYDFRSNAAHLGEVKTKPDTWQQVDEKIEEGIVLAGRIVAAILKRGKWPDWDDLVLGGAQP